MTDRARLLDTRLVVALAVTYCALAQTIRATIGHATIAGLRQEVVHIALIGVAAVVFVAAVAYLAPSASEHWAARTAGTVAVGAGLGAFLHGLIFAFQVRWGAACNQCQPVVYVIVLTMAATGIAAMGALATGSIVRYSRRRGRKRAHVV